MLCISLQITIVMNIVMYKEPDLDDVLYPEWGKSLGWLVAMFPVVVIPAWFMYKYCYTGGFKVSSIIKKINYPMVFKEFEFRSTD